MKTAFQYRLKTAIRKSGYTHQRLANDLDISTSTVASWLHKGKIPRGDTLVAMCRLLGVKAESLFPIR